MTFHMCSCPEGSIFAAPAQLMDQVGGTSAIWRPQGQPGDIWGDRMREKLQFFYKFPHGGLQFGLLLIDLEVLKRRFCDLASSSISCSECRMASPSERSKYCCSRCCVSMVRRCVVYTALLVRRMSLNAPSPPQLTTAKHCA